MRILHVLDHSLPLHSGYTFRTRAILSAQQALGHEVAGVTGVRQGEGERSETVDGITFHRTPAIRSYPPVLREIAEVRVLADRVVAVARDFGPDVLHAHSPVLDAMAALSAGQRLGLPVLYEIRAFWEDAAVGNGTGREGSPRYRATRWLETRACGRADAVAVREAAPRRPAMGRRRLPRVRRLRSRRLPRSVRRPRSRWRQRRGLSSR